MSELTKETQGTEIIRDDEIVQICNNVELCEHNVHRLKI